MAVVPDAAAAAVRIVVDHGDVGQREACARRDADAAAVLAGRVQRFGTLDPSEGGASALRPSETSEFQAMTYVALYRLDLYSNFTLNLAAPGERRRHPAARSALPASPARRRRAE